MLRFIQTSRHEVTRTGQKAILRCEPISEHTELFWYRQTLEPGLELLIYLSNKVLVASKGMPKDRFSTQVPDASPATLKIQPTEARDSATYLCASSKPQHCRLSPCPCTNLRCLLPPAPISSQQLFWAPLPLPKKENGLCGLSAFWQHRNIVFWSIILVWYFGMEALRRGFFLQLLTSFS